MDPIRTPHEKSRFAIPVAVAVAAHAFLFFGFTPPKTVVHPPTSADPTPPRKTPPVDVIELAAPPPDSTAPEPSREPERSAAPVQPDLIPAVIPDSAITVPIKSILPNPDHSKTNVIPMGLPGIGDINGPGGPGILIHSIRDLDNVPRVTFQARPNYPFALRNQGISGEVVVDFLVDERGQVSDLRVIRSSHPEFEQPTLAAVAKWRFEPGKRQGRAVRFRMSQAVTFAVGE